MLLLVSRCCFAIPRFLFQIVFAELEGEGEVVSDEVRALQQQVQLGQARAPSNIQLGTDTAVTVNLYSYRWVMKKINETKQKNRT